MRILILLLIGTLLTLPVYGQKKDTTVIERNGKQLKVIIIDEEEIEEDMEEMEEDLEKMEKDLDKMEFEWNEEEDEDEPETVKTRWGMIDAGFSTYLYNGDKKLIDGPEGTINPMEQNIWKSYNLNIHIFKQKVSLINHYVNLMYGLGFNYHQYEFDNNVAIQERTRQVQFEATPVGDDGRPIDFDVNRLRTWYLSVPLMLNFETNPKDSDKSFRLSAGGFAGLRISANLKTEHDIYKNVTRDDFNLNQFRYGLAGEIGYGWINLYANYTLNGLFKEDANGGYDVAPFNVGVQIVPF